MGAGPELELHDEFTDPRASAACRSPPHPRDTLAPAEAGSSGRETRVSQFEYATVLFSFVAAFGVSELLAGWGRQYRHRSEVRPDPLQLLASLLVLLALLQSIWGSWGFRDVEWTFGAFLLALSPLLPVAGAATLIHPPAQERSITSHREHYFSIHRAAFGLMAAWVVLGAVAEVVLLEVVPHVGQALRALGLVLLVVLAVSKQPRVHWVGLLLLAGLQAGFVAAVTPALG